MLASDLIKATLDNKDFNLGSGQEKDTLKSLRLIQSKDLNLLVDTLFQCFLQFGMEHFNLYVNPENYCMVIEHKASGDIALHFIEATETSSHYSELAKKICPTLDLVNDCLDYYAVLRALCVLSIFNRYKTLELLNAEIDFLTGNLKTDLANSLINQLKVTSELMTRLKAS